MSKRKSSKSCEEDLEQLMHKVRKLERKILKRKNSENVLQQEETVSPPETYAPTPAEAYAPTPPGMEYDESVTLALGPDDWLPEFSYLESGMQESQMPNPNQDLEVLEPPQEQEVVGLPPVQPAVVQGPSEPGPYTSAFQPEDSSLIELDRDILLILGEDPSNSVKYGPDLRKELASRLQHVATEGLSKDTRKELMAKYLTPANCLLINSPKINLEIKAAIPESISKRDKGMEIKQTQMASAISCLAEAISMQISASNKNNELLQKLMDASRLLCDLQHADSVTRRNFILFTLRRDLKEHITNTKIDSFLFGEGLAETLKSAKAVNKTGSELKADSGNKVAPKKKIASNQPLNRKAPVRRPPGPPPQRTRQPATPRAPAPPPPPPAPSSMRSSRPQQPQYPRRRY